VIALLVAWFAFLFAFIGFGGSSGSAGLAAKTDCASKVHQVRVAPSVHVTARGTTAPNLQRARTVAPSRSFPDARRNCGG
jgi:hypothetical protein